VLLAQIAHRDAVGGLARIDLERQRLARRPRAAAQLHRVRAGRKRQAGVVVVVPDEPVEAGVLREPRRGTDTPSPAAALLRVGICASGVTSSRIHIDRPCVDTTMSFLWILMSVTGTFGRFSWKLCQCAPLSGDMNIPNSVPAYSSPSRLGSSRTTRVGQSFGM